MSTGTGSRAVSASSARSRPWSLSTAGCRPRASSRSSASPVSSSREASSSSLAAAASPSPSLARASRSISATDTSRCWAPSWRLRSSRRRCSSPARTTRAREAVRSARAWALATASEASSQNAPSRFSLSGGERILAGDRHRAPERAGDDDRRRRGRAVARAEHRLPDVALQAAPVVDPRGGGGAPHPRQGGVLVGPDPLADAEDVDAVAVVAAEHRRGPVALVAHDRRGVDLQHAGAALGDRGEHALRADLRGDQRRHPPQRALLRRQAADLGELLAGVGGERALDAAARALAVGEVDARRHQRGRSPVGAGHRVVGPRDQPQPALLGPPVADLRARRAGPPDEGQELAERLALLVRDHEVASVAADDLLAPVARRPLAGLVEEQDPPVAVEHADERLGGLGEDPGEGLSDLERPCRLFHAPREGRAGERQLRLGRERGSHPERLLRTRAVDCSGSA